MGIAFSLQISTPSGNKYSLNFSLNKIRCCYVKAFKQLTLLATHKLCISTELHSKRVVLWYKKFSFIDIYHLSFPFGWYLHELGIVKEEKRETRIKNLSYLVTYKHWYAHNMCAYILMHVSPYVHTYLGIYRDVNTHTHTCTPAAYMNMISKLSYHRTWKSCPN